VLDRHDGPTRLAQFHWLPLDRGLMLTCDVTLP